MPDSSRAAERAMADTLRRLYDDADYCEMSADDIAFDMLAALRALPVEQRMEAMGMIRCYENTRYWVEDER